MSYIRQLENTRFDPEEDHQYAATLTPEIERRIFAAIDANRCTATQILFHAGLENVDILDLLQQLEFQGKIVRRTTATLVAFFRPEWNVTRFWSGGGMIHFESENNKRVKLASKALPVTYKPRSVAEATQKHSPIGRSHFPAPFGRLAGIEGKG